MFSEICEKGRDAVELKFPKREDCVICFKTMCNRKVKHLRCKHVFHLGCANRWLEKSPTCPLCRQKPSSVPTLCDAEDEFESISILFRNIMDEFALEMLQDSLRYQYQYENNSNN